MQLTKVIKLELQAEEDAFRILDGQSRICNWLYNLLLELANHLKKEFIATGNLENTKTIYTERGLRNQIPTLKKEKAFLKSIHSSPLKNTALRLRDRKEINFTVIEQENGHFLEDFSAGILGKYL